MSEAAHGFVLTPPHDESVWEGRGSLTREELYALVWQTPMSRLAKQFGLSDVGLRKVCVKYNIPTPPLGYWAKLAHGKHVRQPSLPQGDSRAKIHLLVRTGSRVPPSVLADQQRAATEEADRTRIRVPTERPAKLHPVAAATLRAFREAKSDAEGFKHCKSPGAANTSIGAGSIDRVLCMVDAFARAVEERGYTIVQYDHGVRIVVDAVPLAWHMYEIKDRRPHEPTKEELKEQARRDENRARWPSLYSSPSDFKCYRTWDNVPSGRLSMSISDATCSHWDAAWVVGRWRDRKGKDLEDYLDDAIAFCRTAAIGIKHRLTEKAEQERRRAEELERRRREEARRARALKRHEFLVQRANEFHRLQQLGALATYLERAAYHGSDLPVDLLIDELRTLVTSTEAGFSREVLQKEIGRLQLYTDDDVLELGKPRTEKAVD